MAEVTKVVPEVTMGVVRSRTGIDGEGQFYDYYEVGFFINDARHKLTMSQEKFTAKAAEEAVKKRAAELIAVQNKKVVM